MRPCLAHLGLVALLALAACGGAVTSSPSAGASVAEQPVVAEEPAVASAAEGERHRAAAAAAVAALRRGDFDVAEEQAASLIASDQGNADAQLVWALAHFRGAMQQLNIDVRTVAIAGFEAGGFNHRYMRSSLQQTGEALEAVDRALAVASSQPAISLELCLACWEVDWNHNRRIDRADRLLFQMEIDAAGEEIPDGDPRRKPTFRFDHGDVSWARAFVSFQRAALELVLAYDWDAIDTLLRSRRRDLPKELTIRLKSPERVANARALILDGLRFSAESRQRYLLETDDDREWLPNPRQKDHPLPLPIDQALYDTWGAVVGDLDRLVRGEEGLSLTEIAQLGDHQWHSPPSGYLDVGRLLSQPADIVIPIDALDRAFDDQRLEPALRTLLGAAYRTQMRRSPLPSRLSRMKGEMERGEESFDRKLRYFFWVN